MRSNSRLVLRRKVIVQHTATYVNIPKLIVEGWKIRPGSHILVEIPRNHDYLILRRKEDEK